MLESVPQMARVVVTSPRAPWSRVRGIRPTARASLPRRGPSGTKTWSALVLSIRPVQTISFAQALISPAETTKLETEEARRAVRCVLRRLGRALKP